MDTFALIQYILSNRNYTAVYSNGMIAIHKYYVLENERWKQWIVMLTKVKEGKES